MTSALVFIFGSVAAAAGASVSPLTPVVTSTANAAAREPPTQGEDFPPGRLPSDGPGELIIRQRIIIRIPPPSLSFDRTRPPDTPITGPRCVPAAAIRSAHAGDDRALVLGVGARRMYWAPLGRGCRAMDFHGGIYLSPSADGYFCVRRDMLQARNGARCMIVRLVKLR